MKGCFDYDIIEYYLNNNVNLMICFVDIIVM